MGPSPQTMPTTAQMIFWLGFRSGRPARLIHISTTASGWRKIEMRIQRTRFIVSGASHEPREIPAYTRRMRLLVTAVALIVALAACGGLRGTPPENAGLGAITSITMQKTPCYGTCPAYVVRFLADGRATYAGGDFAPLHGKFSGVFDVAPLAAWIATQHPETLPDKYPTTSIDDQAVNLEIDYGARRVRFTGVAESSASLRLEGILLALDGATARIRWRRDDAATAFLGTFSGALNLTIRENGLGGFSATTTPNGCPQYRYGATVERGTMRLRCETRTTVLRIAGDDVEAVGDAIPAGRYSRANPYATARDNHLDPRPRRPE